MKKQFKLKLRITALGIFVFGITIGFNAGSQTITRDVQPDIAGTVCPNVGVGYTLDVSGTAYTNCSRKWTATNGTIVGSDSGPSVLVKWSDTPGGTASLKCTLSGCTDAKGNPISGTDATFTDQLILSVKDQSISTYYTSVAVDFCSKTTQHLQNTPCICARHRRAW